MKRIFLLFAAVAMIFAFSSCTKEGAFSPKGKLSKVYYSGSKTYTNPEYSDYNSKFDKFLGTHYTWEKKLLTRSDEYYSDGELESTTYYSYDNKNRLDHIILSDNQVVYKYDGNKLKSIEVYDGGTLETCYNITHDGSKISKIEVIYNSSKSTKAINPLEYVFSDDVAESMNFLAEKAPKTRGVANGTYTLKWDGKNVVEMHYEEGSYIANGTYAYDNYKNPYYGFYEDMDVNYFSENNITNVTMSASQGTANESYSRNITYTYDGKYPATKSYSYKDKDYYGDEYTYSQTTYFEYE